MTQKITKAVFPIACLGTRFLPATKAGPEETLSFVDKPLIQYAVEEAITAGIETIVFVTGCNKTSIAKQFDKSYELERELNEKDKLKALDLLTSIVPSHVSCVFTHQYEALGLGHAVLCAKPFVGDEPFAVILTDELIEDTERGCMSQMVNLFNEKNCSIVAIKQVDSANTDKYDVVKTSTANDCYAKINDIIEKPRPDTAPSNLAVVSRYIFTPAIFNKIEQSGTGVGGEIQLTDAITALLANETVLAFEFESTRYHCGDKLGFLIATVEQGLLHNKYKERFMKFFEGLAKIDMQLNLNLLIRLLKVSFIVFYVFGFYALFRQKPMPMPQGFSDFDKIAHFGLFFSLSCFSYFMSSQRYFIYAQLPVLTLAISSEWVQSAFLPQRHFSLGDTVANLVGFLLGCSLCFTLSQHKTRLSLS